MNKNRGMEKVFAADIDAQCGVVGAEKMGGGRNIWKVIGKTAAGLTLVFLATSIDAQSTCVADEIQTSINNGEIELVPMGASGAAGLDISDTDQIKLGFWQNGEFVLGNNGGLDVSGNAFNPNKDTLAIKAVAVGTQKVNYTDGDCSTSPGDMDVTVTGTTPITLESFDGEYDKEEKDVNLHWVTSSEVNNDFFTIEHSTDSKNWNSIGNVNGKGNSSDREEYTFEHKIPIPGRNYYRISQTDYDGTTKVHTTIEVSTPVEKFFNLYPNPATDQITIQLSENMKQNNDVILIYNMQGQLVMSERVGQNTDEISLNIGNLTPGMYTATSSNSVVAKRFIKE